MKKSVKILIGVLIALVIISGFFTFLLFDHTNKEKKIDNLIQNITKEVLTDDELTYLSNKKLIGDEQKKIIITIRNEVVATKWDEHNLDKLENDKKELDDIMNELSKQLTGNIKDRVVNLSDSLNKMKPITQKQKDDKESYLNHISASIEGYSVKELIQKEKELDKYELDINELIKTVNKSKIASLLAKAPKYLTANQIAKHGIQDIDFYENSFDKVGQTFYPQVCQLSPRFELFNYDYVLKHFQDSLSSYPKIDQRIDEYQHKQYYMTYFNTNYNKITTVSDAKNNKTYIIFIGSYRGSCDNNVNGGGAAIIIAYDIETNKIISVVGSQSYMPFIINNEAIGFFFIDGKTSYKDMN